MAVHSRPRSYEDALLLYKNERFGRTLSLLVLALEELGRIPVLLNAVSISRHDQKMWDELMARARRHTLKQGIWTAYGRKLADSEHPDANYFTPALPVNQATLLDKFKQCGFYVTCFDGNFLTPNLFARFDKQKIQNLFELVRNRIEGFRKLQFRSFDSGRMVSQLRAMVGTWSEAQLREEREALLAEWTDRGRSKSRNTVH